MTPPLLLDTNVIIDHLRGRPNAVAFVRGLDAPVLTSVIVVAELYAGVRDVAERARLDEFLSAVTVLELSNPVAVQGGLFRRQFGKSHNVGLEDALIAASAQAEGATLVTLNVKHFPMLANVIVPYINT
jgi:predicted nucleic acid-binding protein